MRDLPWLFLWLLFFLIVGTFVLALAVVVAPVLIVCALVNFLAR